MCRFPKEITLEDCNQDIPAVKFALTPLAECKNSPSKMPPLSGCRFSAFAFRLFCGRDDQKHFHGGQLPILFGRPELPLIEHIEHHRSLHEW